MTARAGWSVVDFAAACLNGGARFLQLRGKDLGSGALLDAARRIVALARPSGAIVIVNDRADVAKLAGADGVHLGQEDLSPAAARALLGPEAIIGRSTHTPVQIETAGSEPVDYVAIGPIFGSTTKATGYQAVGVEMVRRASAAGRPVVAIGGITLENAGPVIGAGAASVAVIGDLLATRDPEGRVRAFGERLSRV